jgi:hypothetical protein
MNNTDYIKAVRLLILVSIISFLCFALMLSFGLDTWGMTEYLIKAYSERKLNGNLVIAIAIFLLDAVSYIYLWQLKIRGVYLYFISTVLWWLYLLITVQIDLSSAPLTIAQAINEYTFVSAVVLTWAYNKKY